MYSNQSKISFFIMLMSFIVSTLVVSTAKAQSDSLSTKTEKLTQTPKIEGYPIYVIGGLGMTLGSNAGLWERQFNVGPAFALGIELPFTKSHVFAFQLYTYAWIGKPKGNNNPNEWGRDFIKLSENYYSQTALFGEIKYYLGDIDSKLRVSFNLGLLFTSSNTSDYGLDFGLGLYYKFNKSISLELASRLNTGRFNIGGGSSDVPNLLMLHFYYNINR